MWWDVERDPVVTWDDERRVFELVDPECAGHRLGLLVLPEAVVDPGELARVLAEGLASCDFPPTGACASPRKVDATLRAANRPERSVEG